MHKWSSHTCNLQNDGSVFFSFKNELFLENIYYTTMYDKKNLSLPHCYELPWRNYKHSNIQEAWSVHSLQTPFLISY